MIKISCKQDWRDFIDDVWDELGKRGKYVKGHFAASLTGDDFRSVNFDGYFYTRSTTTDDVSLRRASTNMKTLSGKTLTFSFTISPINSRNRFISAIQIINTIGSDRRNYRQKNRRVDNNTCSE